MLWALSLSCVTGIGRYRRGAVRYLSCPAFALTRRVVSSDAPPLSFPARRTRTLSLRPGPSPTSHASASVVRIIVLTNIVDHSNSVRATQYGASSFLQTSNASAK